MRGEEGKERRGEEKMKERGRGSLKTSNDLLIDEGPKLRPQITTEPENQSCLLEVCVGGPLCRGEIEISNFYPCSNF